MQISPGSPIDTILAAPEHAPGVNGATKPATGANTNGDDKGSLADRIRALQARSSLPGTIEAVRALTSHPAFTRANPNRVRALVGAFAQGNPLHFHARSGDGYGFLADEVLALDKSNPTTAARLVQPLGQWRRYDAARQGLMRAQLDRILATPGLSPNTYEMVSKSLAE